jgi:hypothetical protein
MSLAFVGQRVQDLSLFTAVRESRLVYPIVLSTHLACIAIFGGLILITNLRLLGWTLTDIPATDLIRSLRRWKQFGFVVMVTCGVLLGASKASEYLPNPFFQLKMGLLIALAAHGIYFRGTVYRTAMPIDARTARTAAIMSLILWVGVVSMGRWIAYYDAPPPTEETAAPSSSDINLATANSVRLPTTTCATVAMIQLAAFGGPRRIMNNTAVPSETCTSMAAITDVAARFSALVICSSCVVGTAELRTASVASPPTNRCQGSPIT